MLLHSIHYNQRFEQSMSSSMYSAAAAVSVSVSVQAEQLRQQLTSKDSQLSELHATLSDLQARLNTSQQQAADLATAADTLQQQLADRDATLLQLRQQQQQQAAAVGAGHADGGRAFEARASEEKVALQQTIAGLKLQLAAAAIHQEQQQQQAADAGTAAAVTVAQADAEAARGAAAVLRGELDGLRAQLSAAAAAGVSAAEGREAELRFLQRQFEEVTQELAQQQEQVGRIEHLCVGVSSKVCTQPTLGCV
jgi:DNA repair exonuclease SbcCD ATPase subunit